MQSTIMAHTFHLEYSVFMVICAVFLGSSVEIVEEPKTDKSCYNVGDSGTVTVSYSVADMTNFRDLYKVVLRNSEDVIIKDGSLMLGDNAEDKEARWITSILYNNTIVDYKIYTGCPIKNGTVDFQYIASGKLSIFFRHRIKYFPQKRMTPKSLNLMK